MECRCAAICFTGNLVKPLNLSTELLDHQADHPRCFMEAVAHFFLDGVQRSYFTGQLSLEKFFAPLELFTEDARPCLPGKGHPGEERRTVALVRPVFTFQSSGKGLAAFCGSGEDAALRTKRRSPVFR